MEVTIYWCITQEYVIFEDVLVQRENKLKNSLSNPRMSVSPIRINYATYPPTQRAQPRAARALLAYTPY